MSVMPVTYGNALQDLARALFNSVDSNADGQMGLDEFTVFLNRLVTTTTSASQSTVTGSAFSPVTTTALTFSAGPRSSMEGFDFGKIANTGHQTIKYRFARVAWNYDLSAVKDKAGAESVLRSMVPDLEKAGLTVADVSGDKVKLKDGTEEFWVDVVRGANSGSPAFQWLDLRYA